MAYISPSTTGRKMYLRLPELRRTAHRKEEFLYYLFIHKGLSASLSNCAYLLLESNPRLTAVPLTETYFH
jgi:hypothetical protein